MNRTEPIREKEHSPWGTVQTVEKPRLADGSALVQFVSTPSHGGYYVNEAARRMMPYEVAHEGTFAGEGWYEEDCDWALVAVGLPHLFNDYEVRSAVRAIQKNDYFKGARKWLLDASATTARGVLETAALWENHYRDHYEFASGGTSGAEWRMYYKRVHDGKTINVFHSRYGAIPQVASMDEILATPGASVG